MKNSVWYLICFFCGILAASIYNISKEPERINGPDFTAFQLRDIFNKQKAGCSLASVSGSSVNGGEWNLDYICPNGNIQSPVFTNTGEEKTGQ
ncbi:hypothetical protein B1277_17995 [Salmonella enterica subsp. enterica serovar Tennessee]|uniref:Uncharacterized protein n=2 Tax=Salmonella enterica I TaxID=59201 RepID=A0A629CCA8_SALET|nr:hypothetical protein [Salmonella enterica]EAA7927957.1 hypothetical protein [Salmonella enterica subsp. enterica serovar Kottbus]EBY4406399.1 hypothetical protein [Salmonella enterica subsp. enterica serovar Brunei]ECH8152907.1 hypothetical protein [Salmonella enterica subsp. enterica serovar Tennessee]EDQ9673069.1 hypothetical protein [Salmonella enterica subsp. enterica]EDT6073975.1 hypothetical protein [Salmonella enterica subsp. enterica serovar Livingstone]EGI5899552.1 hypothetical pr